MNPWSQVYKIAVGKTKEVNKMTTINRPDGIETTSLQETINEILDHLYKEDGEEKPNHKTIRKAVEEPIHTEDDVEFTPDEIKHTIESFGQKKASGPDGIRECFFRSPELSPPHTHTHTRTHTHTHARAHTHTHTHARACARARTHTHTHTHPQDVPRGTMKY